MVEWNFPGNGNGQIEGIANAGIETFGGSELQALAREICQNSLDALCDGQTSVAVEFFRYFIPTSSIPGYGEYVEILEKCNKFWMQQKSEKAKEYLRKALKTIHSDNIFVLRVSDYNTTGLLGPYDDRFDGWNALTKIDGGATKDGDKAGSFGIGKNAPFCNSYFRLVFYRTMNTDNEIAAQGMSRLLSFPQDEADVMGSMTTGIGYFGESKNKPIKKIQQLDDLFIRRDLGTDIFVYGFNGSGKNWIDAMFIEILNNFMMSIYNKKMTIRIQDQNLDDLSLSFYMEKYRTNLKQAYCYYQVISRTKDVTEYSVDFHGLGTLKLRVLVDENEKLSRKVLITRSSGMKLFDLGNISRAISFSGILEMQGEKLNSFFREMETPSHDKWLPSRHSNPDQAKAYYDELRDWVRSIVLSLGEYSSDEEIEVEGLGGILQNESELAKQYDNEKKEYLNNNLGEIIISQRDSHMKNSKGLFYGNGSNGKNKTNDVMGDISSDGIFSTTRMLHGTRNRTKKEEHRGLPSSEGKSIVHQTVGNGKNCPLEKVRIIKINNNDYMVNFMIPHDITEGHIDIVTVGENGKYNRLKIKCAKGIAGCSGTEINFDQIKFKSMKGNAKVEIEISLVDNREYAMEVNVYEHN